MKQSVFKKFVGEKAEMNCDTSLELNTDAEIIISSKYFQNCELKKSKRYRSAFTTEQINYLEREFKKFPYIGSANRKEVANILKISERAVKIWFQNRRMKEKREVNNNKEQLIDDKNNTNSAFTNDQINNRNVYLHNDCGNNELFLSNRCRNKHLKEPNIETGKANYTLNVGPNLTNQIKMDPVHNINMTDNKCINKTMNMIKDTRHTNRFKSTLLQKVKSDTIKNPVVKEKKRQQFSDVNKGFKSEIKNPITLINRKKCELVQNLSLNNIVPDQKEHQQLYPVHSNTDQSLVPLFTQGYYMPQPIAATQAIHSGNVMWKPVSVMPILPGLSPASTMTIGHNGPGISLSDQDTLKGSCNCNSPQHIFNARMQCVAKTQPQYIFAIPFNNSSNKI